MHLIADFEMFDTDGSGTLTIDEIQKIFKRGDEPMTDEEIEKATAMFEKWPRSARGPPRARGGRRQGHGRGGPRRALDVVGRHGAQAHGVAGPPVGLEAPGRLPHKGRVSSARESCRCRSSVCATAGRTEGGDVTADF